MLLLCLECVYVRVYVYSKERHISNKSFILFFHFFSLVFSFLFSFLYAFRCCRHNGRPYIFSILLPSFARNVGRTQHTACTDTQRLFFLFIYDHRYIIRQQNEASSKTATAILFDERIYRGEKRKMMMKKKNMLVKKWKREKKNRVIELFS